MTHPDLNASFMIEQATMIADCYAQVTGQSLRKRLGLDEHIAGTKLVHALYHAPAAILSHDLVFRGHSRDNVYNYANLTAQSIFERSFTEFTTLASSLSTGESTVEQTQRNSLLAQSLAHGSVRFNGTRQSANGKTVVLNNAILFVLFDTAGLYRGQAVVFDP